MYCQELHRFIFGSQLASMFPTGSSKSQSQIRYGAFVVLARRVDATASARRCVVVVAVEDNDGNKIAATTTTTAQRRRRRRRRRYDEYSECCRIVETEITAHAVLVGRHILWRGL